jgi:hypothetical protein
VEQCDRDRNFICAARNALPALLAELRLLRAAGGRDGCCGRWRTRWMPACPECIDGKGLVTLFRTVRPCRTCAARRAET